MATPEAQRLVDATEADVASRYKKRREFRWLVQGVAEKQAAYDRLEFALRRLGPGSVQTNIRHGRGLVERDGLA